MRLRRWFCAALLACASLAPRLGAAQSPPADSDVATARKLTVEGYAALDQRDFARAENRFSRAEALFHAPTVSLGLARARAGLGRLVGAQEAYSRVVHTTVPADASPVLVKAIEDARKELDALTPRVPSIVIVVKGSGTPKVTVDGTEVSNAALGEQRPIDPGRHVVRAAAPGFVTSEATVTLAEGKTETVTLELKPGENPPAKEAPAPQAPPSGGSVMTVSGGAAPGGDQGASHASPMGPIGFAAIGIGAAGLVTGVATGVVGLQKQSDLLKHCPSGACPSNSTSQYGTEVNTYQTMQAVSAIGLAVGGALAVTGVILVATAPKGKAPAAMVTPAVGPGYLGLQGRF